MLIALADERRVEAWSAEKGPAYICPNCRKEMILRKGQVVTHHFAHKPPVTCLWARGETQAHLKAKKFLYDMFSGRGLRAEVECEVLSDSGDRRADVLVWGRNGTRVAFEVQHQPLDFEAIERRTRAYMAADVPVTWIALISGETLEKGDPTSAGRIVKQYSVRPWEKWAHAYSMGSLWFIDPENGTLWQGVLKEHLIEVPSSHWYTSDGDEQSAGGYTRYSKRWRTLHLTGPIAAKDVSVQTFNRSKWTGKSFSLPAGVAAKLAINA